MVYIPFYDFAEVYNGIWIFDIVFYAVKID